MKMGTVSWIIGIVSLIASIIATVMGHSEALPVGIIMFSMGFMAQLFEHEFVDCLLITFVGVAALVFVLNFAQTSLGGGHGSAHGNTHETAPATTGEHK